MDFNQSVIEEFRNNHGIVKGPFEGSTMLLLTTTGVKTGQKYVTPLVYTTEGNKYVVIASKGGADTNPHWFYNLKANPEVVIEMGDDKFTAKAQITDEDERKRLYAKHSEQYPNFLDYQNNTERAIPVILLEKIN